MKKKFRNYVIILAVLWVSLACKYVVVPADLIVKTESFGEWKAVITNVTQNEQGDLHVDITIQNDSGEWSAMQADPETPVLYKSDGKTTNCDVVFIGTGGHRLAPGLQIRGYTTGMIAEPEVQLLYVECAGVEYDPDSELIIDYIAFNGPLDYYHQEDNKSTGTIELALDEVGEDLSYPVVSDIDEWVVTPDTDIPAISNNVVNLVDVQRTETGLTFTWKNYNPTDFALKTHIGRPPVVGDDGIIYGVYQIMDMVSVPITPAGGESEWTTDVKIPPNLENIYILLSVEDRQMRLYVNHLIDITDQ
jgi:hypothetical protein